MVIGGVAAVAAERTFPFRVFSFPSEIKIPEYYSIHWPCYKRDWTFEQTFTFTQMERDLEVFWKNFKVSSRYVYQEGQWRRSA